MKIYDKNEKLVAEVTALDGSLNGVDAGLWVTLKTENGTKPTLCLISNPEGFYVGLYRDTESQSALSGCDFAVKSGRGGVTLQVVKDGKALVVDLHHLLSKLV